MEIVQPAKRMNKVNKKKKKANAKMERGLYCPSMCMLGARGTGRYPVSHFYHC